MTFDSNAKRSLFPENTSAQNVVRALLVMRQAHHEQELQRLKELLTDFPNPYADKLTAAWEHLKAECGDEGEALCQLTQILLADLEAGQTMAPAAQSLDT